MLATKSGRGAEATKHAATEDTEITKARRFVAAEHA